MKSTAQASLKFSSENKNEMAQINEITTKLKQNLTQATSKDTTDPVNQALQTWMKSGPENDQDIHLKDIVEDEFKSMVETSPINTSLMEFRDTSEKLIGVVLLDFGDDDLSAVYSFFDPSLDKLGVGNFMITQCILFEN